MDAAAALPPCRHCGLPVGVLGRRRDDIDGDGRWFCCHGCCLAYQLQHGARDEPEAAAWLIRLGVGGFLAMNVMLLSLLLYADAFGGADAWLRQPVHGLLWLLTTPMLVLLGAPFAAGAWRALRRGRLVTDSLVTIGVLAAYGYSVWQLLQGSPLVYFDTATMVLLLFTLGRTLEAQGRARAARRLAPMLAAERDELRVVGADGVERALPPAAVGRGDRVRVRPGERIGVDGVVAAGRSEVDESVLSGQPQRVAKAPGARVVAGSVNGDGLLTVVAGAPALQTRWVQIGRAVRDALAVKTLAGDSVDRVAAAFIPAVLLLAAATAAYWGLRSGADAALLAGLSVLVVACPCALALAAPLASAQAIGRAAERGILLRSGRVLERLAALRGVAFDKTGTLTQPALAAHGLRCVAAGGDAEALRRAGALARASTHPVAAAVAARAGPGPLADAVESSAGGGLCGRVDGEHCALGSAAFLGRLGWRVPAALRDDGGGHGAVFVGWAGQAQARLALDDDAAPVAGAADVVAALRRRGLATLLLSGDRADAVAALAGRLGIGAWHAELLPAAKVARLRDWSARHGPLAMVGDGLNDAPVLAAASVGIAVGGAADLARESADVVLPPGGLGRLPWLLDEARRMRRSLRMNLRWALGYNAIALALAAGGQLRPELAAALMAGSSLLIVLRSWRADRRATADEAAPPLAPAATAAAEPG